MAQSRSSAKIKELLRQKPTTVLSKDDSGCDTCPEDNLDQINTQYPDSDSQSEGNKKKTQNKPQSISSINLRSTNRNKDTQCLPDVGGTGISPTTHSNMKTKQAKEEQDKSLDEETVIEPKTRARKKASDIADDDKTKSSQDEPKASKEAKKVVNKPKAVVKKRPLGIRKTLRSKKTVAAKDKVKNAVKKTITRGRKAALKLEPDNSQDKETVPLIPASEIKKEPVDDTPNSRSSSPKTAGRRQRLSSDLVMMKTMLGESPGSLVLGPRTSPYSMRSERSNSPSMFEGKNLRSGKPRKVKNNLLNEVVMKEQKKRRRLLSDSKNSDVTDTGDECKKLKRGRSCSREGSEISKCSDNTESDMSLSEPLEEGGKELNKILDKSKTDLDVDIENNVQISSNEKVPSVNDDKHSEPKANAETSCVVNEKNKKKLSLKRSTSLDSDNNNSNRINLDNLNSSEIESKLLMKTENDVLMEARSSILSSMSKTFNTKEITKNIKKARRGRRAAAAARPDPNKACMVTAISNSVDDKQETIESLSKEIDDLINNLDENIDQDHAMATEASTTENTSDPTQTKQVSKLYGLPKPLVNSEDNNVVPPAPETPVKKIQVTTSVTNENTPSKIDDSETIRLHYEEDTEEKSTEPTKHEITYNCTSVASIDKLMDRLKEFEEFDKKRQRLESESKVNDTKTMMVTSDVVLIPKSGADIKPLKDIQSVRSPERPIEKENVLSCFENNSAISIVKRDQVRKSIDVDLPNSVTLIKRNSFSSRKESISSNHSRESDAISIFEKSLGKDVTLTEIRKSVEKSAPVQQVDLHQFATLHPNNPGQNLVPGVVLDSNEISITPRVMTDKSNINDVKIIPKRKSRESITRKSSESTNEEEKLVTIEKIKSPPPPNLLPAVSISTTSVSAALVSATPVPVTAVSATPVAIKSPESMPMESEALPPPLENIKSLPQDASLTSEISKICSIKPIEATKPEHPSVAEVKTNIDAPIEETKTLEKVEEKVEEKPIPEVPAEEKELPIETEVKVKVLRTKSARNSTESQTRNSTEIQAGSSNTTVEVVEKKKRKDLVRKISTTSNKDVSEDKTEKVQNDISICAEPTVASEPVKEKEMKTTVEDKPTVAEPETKRAKSPKAKAEVQPGPSNVFNETPETKKHKEYVLRTLGLLTHKAAKEAKIEKLKEKERIYGGMMSNKSKAAKSGLGDYTGTLKTVIKLNRGTGDRDKKKQRTSLKMTFQKSKYRSGKPTPDVGEAAQEDEYYTIERREGVAGAATDGGHRKSHYSNRLNNHETEAVPEPADPKETGNLVIPEKASSFSIHPGRLCMDQCFYCGGKFGLFDTPCHIAQIKSSERQKKILDNEEKLTIDSCLCDACYRHVDRRANCPSYRKRPPGRQPDAPPLTGNNQMPSEKPPSPPLEEESEEEPSPPGVVSGRIATCHTEGCVTAADYSIRRKWLIKMRTSVNKVLKLKCDYPGLHTLPLCAAHYRVLAPLMACVLCRRRLTKHHNLHFINHGFLELNPLLTRESVPVQFTERPVLCKGCRYYCTLLQRPGHNDLYARAYRRKLLQVYNIEVPPESENEGEEMTTQDDPNSLTKPKKKQRTKSKQRKSTEPEQSSESSEKTNESTPEKDKIHDDSELSKESSVLREEEDIESLISSNKILVPGAVKSGEMGQSDGSEAENVCEFDTPFLHVDKQTELQYLLQKQNNPAQFLQKPPNLTQKQRNIMKIQNVPGIQKPGQQQRINDKNAKRIHKIGQMVQKVRRDEDDERSRDGIPILKNINLNDECTIETIPNRRSADINTLKNKWQMSESFTQVKKNLSELSKKLTIEKDTKKPSEAKYSNPVKRLETNPSISVRELFPGEEEMNLQCNIEFNNVKGVTPEGWEKCNTLIQYDVETRKLWTELQRPYGNQSSFLRHLILLEKYFRSGDLVLSHNASPHAANYSDSVQSRLRAYDNVVNDAPRRNEPAISLIEFRKKPSINGKSLLKSNQEPEKDTKKFMPPPPMLPKPKTVKEKPKSKPLPPELIAINTPNAQGRKAIQNVLHNIQQLVKGVSASDPTEVAAAPLPPPKYETPKEKKETPKADTPKKAKATSKPWRPTLMPITQENLAKIAREPTQVAVDGRSLPSLVQVMSSGKRYHITLQDYNKMCIMRREKLQQLRDGDKKRNSTEETTVVTEIQPSTMLGNGGTVVQNIVEEKQDKKEMPELGQMGNAATILKNVGLKNITIAPIPPKTATVTSMTLTSPIVTSPSLLVTSTPIKIPQLGSAVSITSETVLTPNVMTQQLIMPKIPKSLTVIPQTIMGGQMTTAVTTMSASPDPSRP